MNPKTIWFKRGDRGKVVQPEPWEEHMQNAVGTVMESSRVPFVQFDEFGKVAMLQSQLALCKVIKLENK